MSNVPKLRFKEFDGEWEEKTLGYLIKSLDAGVSVNSTDQVAKDGEKAILKTSCVSYGTFNITENKLVFEKNEVSRLKEPVKANTIIISRMNTPALVGANAFVKYDNENVFLPDRLWAAKVKSTASPEWTAILTSSSKIRTLLSARATGTSNSMKNITKGDVLTLPIVVPSKQEQEKIASFLTSVDTKIEQLTRKEELLQQYKKGVMQKLFSQEIRFKADDGSEFPDWEENNIEEIVKEYNDKTTETDQYPILSSTKDGIVLQSEYFDKQTASTDNTGYKIVPKGYFTYRSMSDTGSFTFNQQNLINIGVVSPAYPVFKCNSKIVERFLEITLNNSPEIIQQILMLKEGGTRLALGFNKFKKLYISLPCLEEQTKIANFLSSIDSKIEQVQKQLNSTKEFKKALLQQMFV